MTTSLFAKVTTRWSSGSSEDWMYLGYPFEVGRSLPASLEDELMWKTNQENDDEHYRGCSIDVAVPPVEVVEAELRRASDQFKSAEAAVKALDEVLASMRSGGGE